MFHARQRLALIAVAACAAFLGATASSAYAASFAAPSDPNNSARGELDPNNPTNQVFAFKTDATHFGSIVRSLGTGIPVANFRDQLQLKYYLQNKTCAGGSPRFQLSVDQDGNGTVDHEAFGYLGTLPFGGGCNTNQWTFQDGSDGVARWDLSQFGGSPANTFDQMVTFFETGFPNHKVKAASIVEDPGAAPGCSFYDQLDFYRAAATNWTDVAEPTNTALCP
jgi:hypothetical protein